MTLYQDNSPLDRKSPTSSPLPDLDRSDPASLSLESVLFPKGMRGIEQSSVLSGHQQTHQESPKHEGVFHSIRARRLRLAAYAVIGGAVACVSASTLATAYQPWQSLYEAAVFDHPKSLLLEPVRLFSRALVDLGVNPRFLGSLPVFEFLLSTAGGALVAWGVLSGRSALKLQESDCLGCGYDLSDVVAHGKGCTCPECGKNSAYMPKESARGSR